MSNHVLSSSTRYGHYLEILLIFFLCSLNKLKWKWLTFSPCALLFSSLNHWTQFWLSIDPQQKNKNVAIPVSTEKWETAIIDITFKSASREYRFQPLCSHFHNSPARLSGYQGENLRQRISNQNDFIQARVNIFLTKLGFVEKNSCFLFNIPSCICFCGGGCRVHRMFYGIWDRGRFPFSHSLIGLFS